MFGKGLSEAQCVGVTAVPPAACDSREGFGFHYKRVYKTYHDNATVGGASYVSLSVNDVWYVARREIKDKRVRGMCGASGMSRLGLCTDAMRAVGRSE